MKGDNFQKLYLMKGDNFRQSKDEIILIWIVLSQGQFPKAVSDERSQFPSASEVEKTIVTWCSYYFEVHSIMRKLHEIVT